jgi:hypothetical protein
LTNHPKNFAARNPNLSAPPAESARRPARSRLI